MLPERADQIARIDTIGNGTITQRGTFNSADDAVTAIEHCKQKSFRYCGLEPTRWITGKGHGNSVYSQPQHSTTSLHN
ncbi:hypothetical protein BCCGELA001_05345 [Bradyrhizobium sp. CCGE-LA001]|nr:hypothetical protein BCCGELA001_05345 [Bradyrhizobium sp. CCGE-LA001]